MKYLVQKPDNFLNSLNNEINTVLHRGFDSLFPEYLFSNEMQGLAMPIDLKETDTDYKVKVELPGVKKEDVEIDISENHLTISAKKEEEKEEKTKKYHKSEFRYGNYSRTVYFPDTINLEHANAHLKNGVLKIELPKLKVNEPEKRKLTVE